MPPPYIPDGRPAPPSASVTVLRPELYNRLVRRFGRVKVSNQGTACTYSIVRKENGYKTLVCNKNVDPTHTFGETYRVNCPYCADSIFRLNICHLWGFRHPDTGSRNLWMAHCYNEDCVNDHGQYEALYGEVFSEDPVPAGRDQVFGGSIGPVDVGPITPPGPVRPIDGLAKDHPARLYLEKRGYDVKYLTDRYEVGYVLSVDDVKNWAHRSRIFIPVLKEHVLVGYQTRYVGTPDHRGVPKYLNAQFPRSGLLYNCDRAREFPYTVVLEGATKVWRYGPEAVATFGKIVTPAQTKLLAEGWKTVVVVLDPNARENALQLMAALTAAGVSRALLDLPEGVEPDEMTTSDLRALVAAAAAREGLSLS